MNKSNASRLGLRSVEGAAEEAISLKSVVPVSACHDITSLHEPVNSPEGRVKQGGRISVMCRFRVILDSWLIFPALLV